MLRSVVAVAVSCSVAVLVPGTTSSAAPVPESSGTLVVNTLIGGSGESPVLEATGAFSGCVTVTQLDEDNAFVRGTAVFRGHKQIDCTGGTILVAYNATFDKQLPGTRGSWRVVEGTGEYLGVAGGGRLAGDDTMCDPMGTDGCVLDTFTGVLT